MTMRIGSHNLRGAALDEVRKIAHAWFGVECVKEDGFIYGAPPMGATWPKGTTFEWAVSDEGYEGVRVELPSKSGGRTYRGWIFYHTEMPKGGETMPVPINWTVNVQPEDGVVFASPGVDCSEIVAYGEDATMYERLSYGADLGLRREYRIGMLSRPLREKFSMLPDGWEFGPDE